MRGTFMESDQPSGNLLYFRRRLMETEHEHKKLEQYSDGLKMMRQLRDSVVPMGLFRAPDAARRRLTSRAGGRPVKQPKRTPSLESEDGSPEMAHRKAELEKLYKLRSEYSGNPNRSKLSTRLSRTDTRRSRRLATDQVHALPPTKPKPKPKPGPGDSRGSPQSPSPSRSWPWPGKTAARSFASTPQRGQPMDALRWPSSRRRGRRRGGRRRRKTRRRSTTAPAPDAYLHGQALATGQRIQREPGLRETATRACTRCTPSSPRIAKAPSPTCMTSVTSTSLRRRRL